jgi:cysteine-rich repeat protein
MRSKTHRLQIPAAWLLVSSALVTSGCGDDLPAAGGGPSTGTGGEGGKGTGGSPELQVEGGAEKGPYIVGSSVLVSLLSTTGSPTGDVFATQIADDDGAFSLAFTWDDLVSVEANGFYFNELQGQLSGAELTLRAYGDLGSSNQLFLNIITHLTYQRVQKLIEEGASFADASGQAEAELIGAHGIGPAAFDPQASANQTSLLSGDSDASAYVLAVGAVFLQAAVTEAAGVGSVDAIFQQRLNTTAAAFAATGTLPMSTQQLLAQAELDLDGGVVMANLAQRFLEIGSAAVVPNINRVLDPDQDDIANLTDNCPDTTNPGQEDADLDGVGDVCECGNGVLDGAEACDDGNQITLDGCEADCTTSCEIVFELPPDLRGGRRLGGVFSLDNLVVFFIGGEDPFIPVYRPYVFDQTSRTALPLDEASAVGDTRSIALMGGLLYWLDHSGNLWRTDGTPAGTTMTGVSEPSAGQVLALDGGLYIAAGSSGVLRSDGTPAGTFAVSEYGYFLAPLGSDLLFLVPTASDQTELWRSSGAPMDATLVASLPAGSPSAPIPTTGGLAFMVVQSASSSELVRTDGTAGGTFTLYEAASPSSLSLGVELNGDLYFGVSNSTDGLYRTDGTIAGTVGVDIGFSHAFPFAVFDGSIMLEGGNPSPVQLVRSDGTEAGTIAVANTPNNLYRNGALASHFFFSASPGELWVTDGGGATNRRVVSDIIDNAPIWSGNVSPIWPVGDYLYLMRNDLVTWINPWRCRVL